MAVSHTKQVLFYLTDVEEGGETCFPAASDVASDWAGLKSSDDAIRHFLAPEHETIRNGPEDGERPEGGDGSMAGGVQGGGRGEARAMGGVKVKPRRGDAVVWYNYEEGTGRIDPRAVHCALPVTRGEKWAANCWVSLTPSEILSQLG